MRAVGEIFIVGVSYGAGEYTHHELSSLLIPAGSAGSESCGHSAVYCFIRNRSIVQEELNLALDLSLMIGNPKVYLHLGLVFCEGSFLHCEQSPLWDKAKAEDELHTVITVFLDPGPPPDSGSRCKRFASV